MYPFIKGTFHLRSYYEFSAGYATRNEHVNGFSYAGSIESLFVVEYMYGGFQHLLIKYRDLCSTPLGSFFFC